MGETVEEPRRAGGTGRGHRWTAAVVAVHLVLALAHGLPHEVAPVPLATWQTAFVAVVVFAGPPVGLWFAWRGYGLLGGGLLAATGAASFLFGTYFHFVSDTADNVARVDGAWGGPFLVTAVLLSVAALAVTVAGVVRWRAAA
jgi:hypothetical protein